MSQLHFDQIFLVFTKFLKIRRIHHLPNFKGRRILKRWTDLTLHMVGLYIYNIYTTPGCIYYTVYAGPKPPNHPQAAQDQKPVPF
jgi:hypothetical protein